MSAWDRFVTWALRTPASQLAKFSRINPVYPFIRRSSGIYSFSRTRCNDIWSGIGILLVSIIYFAITGTCSDASFFTRPDLIFFPCLGIFISIHIIWRSAFPVTIVLNYPKFRYEYYVGEQVISCGPLVDAYVKLKVLFAGEEDMLYHIVLGATDMPELEFTALSANGQLYRTVAKRLARTLNVNYFDMMDLSPLHECRHATTRHLDTISGQESGILRSIQAEIRREHLLHKIDLFTEDFHVKPNLPFGKVEDLNLGIPLEKVKKIRDDQRNKQTLAWKLGQIPVKFLGLLCQMRIGLIGRSQKDDVVTPVSHTDEEEVDKILKQQLIGELESAERNANVRKRIRPLLALRTGKFDHRTTPLSVDERAMMQLVARYMALRMLIRTSGQEVPGMSEKLSFMGMFTSHAEYPGFYHAAMEGMDSMWKRGGFVGGGGGGAGRNRQVHPEVVTQEHTV